MQLKSCIMRLRGILAGTYRYNTNKTFVRKNVRFSYPINFVSTGLDSSVYPTPSLNIKGFFLESSINSNIKSVPIFMFSLQKPDMRETFISCFYGENNPTLFENMSKNNSIIEPPAFFFNWFEHESLVPSHPEYRDDISNSVYYNEGRFLDYRVFDSTAIESNERQRLLYSKYLSVKAFPKKRFILRNRFYKRKFDWFLKQQLPWT